MLYLILVCIAFFISILNLNLFFVNEELIILITLLIFFLSFTIVIKNSLNVFYYCQKEKLFFFFSYLLQLNIIISNKILDIYFLLPLKNIYFLSELYSGFINYYSDMLKSKYNYKYNIIYKLKLHLLYILYFTQQLNLSLALISIPGFISIYNLCILAYNYNPLVTLFEKAGESFSNEKQKKNK
jgi:hypothetical protein